MWRLYKTGIGLTTGFIGSHTITITVYTLHNSLLQLQIFSEDPGSNCCNQLLWHPLPSLVITNSLVKVKLTLRPTTSRSVSPGFKAHEGLTTGYLFLLTFTCIVLSITGAPSHEESRLSFVMVIWTVSVQYSKFAAGPRQHSISPYL
jgi:hypothetical protein